MAAKYISHQIINHPSKVKSVCESGDRFFILSLCTNLGQCENEKRLAEAEEKLREYLRITEKGKWYLGANQWRWTRNRRVSRSSLKKFHPGFRPGTTYALARKVPAFDELPSVLKPTAFGLLPQITHYGHIIKDDQFFDIAATQLGFSRETSGDSWAEDVAVHTAAGYISREIIHHRTTVGFVCVEDNLLFVLSLCTN
ncbi:hypothetical protein BKA93DRAFT_778342 [Sparassis latifolia]